MGLQVKDSRIRRIEFGGVKSQRSIGGKTVQHLKWAVLLERFRVFPPYLDKVIHTFEVLKSSSHV